MSNKSVQNIVAIILLIAAAVLVLWVLVMWTMPWMMDGMMGGMTGDGMMDDGMMGEGMMWSTRGWMFLWTAGPLLLAALLVVLAIVLFRSP